MLQPLVDYKILAGYQKNQAMIRSLVFFSPNPPFFGEEREVKTELIFNHAYMMKSP